jgi:hypothetical protein
MLLGGKHPKRLKAQPSWNWKMIAMHSRPEGAGLPYRNKIVSTDLRVCKKIWKVATFRTTLSDIFASNT